MSNGLDVVVDGACQVALGVEMVAVLTKDIHKAVRVVMLRFCDPEI